MKIKNRTVAAELGLLFITIIWGGSFVVVKNTTSMMPANYIIAIRFGLASIFMLIFFFRRIQKIDAYSIKSGAILGVLLYVAYYFQTVGIKYTTAGNNAFLTAVYVILVPFLYWVIKKIRPDAYNIISAFVCIAGIGFLSIHAGFTVNIGDSLSLLCGIAFSAQIVGVSILTEKGDPILLAFTQCIFTAIIAFIVALCTEKFPAQLVTNSIWDLLYIGVFSTMIAMVVQTVCQKYVPPSRASLIMSMESLFGTFFGIVFLNEALTFKTFIGFLLIFAAMLVSETKLSFLRQKNESVSEEPTSLI